MVRYCYTIGVNDAGWGCFGSQSERPRTRSRISHNDTCRTCSVRRHDPSKHVTSYRRKRVRFICSYGHDASTVRDFDGRGFYLSGELCLKKGCSIVGVTTAATLWIITVIGLCFGGGQLALGVVPTILSFLTLGVFKKIDMRFLESSSSHRNNLK